jgi:DNA-binding transcriptional MerR regulator
MDGHDRKDAGARLTIGQLARRTGLTVKTIRWYSDQGLVPPAGRSAAGYRLYDVEALARLELVRTLRRLDIDLRTIERVLAREIGLAEVAATHVEALDAEIRSLRLRRAVLRIVAERGGSPEEVVRMHELARLSEEERRHIITDFFDDVFGGLSIDPEFESRMRSVMPDLPDEPTPEQIDAWTELATLVGDAGFRQRIRQMAEDHSAARERAEEPGAGTETSQAGVALVAEKAGDALARGIDPASAEGQTILAELLADWAAAAGTADSPGFRAQLLANLESGTDARAERYWQLLGIINGWPPIPSVVPAFEWLIAALRDSRFEATPPG